MAQVQTVSVFCEDARDEVSGAVTLVGVMTDNLSLPGVPGMIPKLVVYTRILVPVDYRLKSLSAFLRLSTGNEEGHQAYEPSFLEETIAEARARGAPNAGFIMTTIASPFPVPDEMKAYMIVVVDGEEHISGYLNLEVPKPNA